MAFSELIRNFDKIREYMRDFYIYGFKRRGDFDRKSARTYDDEKRRIESYLGDYIRWSHDKNGKRTFISLDSATLATNPLYAAWKSKSFTARDIMLHFYILDALRGGGWLTIEQLTDYASERGELTFEVQTVRLKCAEYLREGLLLSEKRGRAMYYALCPDRMDSALMDAVQFYQLAAPFGEVGSSLLDSARVRNELFRFQHHYIVHTLEDGVLLDLLRAMREHRKVRLVTRSARTGRETELSAVPMRIFQSAASGRRYICVYSDRRGHFVTHRLDAVRSAAPGEPCEQYDELVEALEQILPLVWGVSFGGHTRKELLCMKLYIDEQYELYVLERLHREGRGGKVLRLEENVFLYTKEILDTGELSTWIKTFTGRILQLEGTNHAVVNRFYSDMERMRGMYLIEETV